MNVIATGNTVESLEDLTLNSYDLWNKKYQGEDYQTEEDDVDICKDFEAASGNSFQLEQILRKYLCLLDDSSGFAEDFEEKEFQTISRIGLDPVPQNLPSTVLDPASELLCFVSCYGPPIWLNSMLHACHRCAEQRPLESGYLHAINRLLVSQFHKETVSFDGFGAILAAATNVVQSNDTFHPVPLVNAVKALCSYVRTSDKPSAELFLTFSVLQHFIETNSPQLSPPSNANSQDSSMNDLSRLMLMSISEILLAAAALSKSSEGENQLMQSGFIPAMVIFTRDHCIPQDNAMSYGVISSTAVLLQKLILPKKFSPSILGKFEDSAEMKKLFEELHSKFANSCDQVLHMKGHIVIAYALFREDSGNHLQSRNSGHLAGLLSLLMFSSQSGQKEMINDLQSIPRFFDCLRTHAMGEIWTYTGHCHARIHGLTKEALIARLLLALHFPDCYPDPSQVSSSLAPIGDGAFFGNTSPAPTAATTETTTTPTPDTTEGSSDSKKGGNLLPALLLIPSPENILKEAIASRTWMLETVLDEWMLCLKILPAAKI
jgi:hypothetical protein